MALKSCFLIGYLLLALTTNGQTHRFESEIQKFEAADRQAPPPKDVVVFTGSSSIRFWDDLPRYFPGKIVLQRGFGGSELSDVRHFADRIIVRYQPKQVVLYAGENDVAIGNQTARQTYDRFVDLFRYVRRQLPDTRFTFISLKPSPSRRKFRPVVDETNRLIKRYLARRRNTDFVDIVPAMLKPNGEPRGELFKGDSLHMTPKGYELWGEVVRPFVK